MQVNSRKQIILSGEPLAVDFEITNRSDKDIKVDFGPEEKAFWCEIESDKGEIVATSQQIFRGGFRRGSFYTIAPGKSAKIPLVVNWWCSTLLPAGKYTVVINWKTDASKNYQAEGRGTFDLAILSADEDKLSRIFNQLKDDALDIDSPTSEFSVRMLLYSRAPSSARAIKSYLTKATPTERMQFGRDWIDSLGRFEGVESIQMLSEVALENDSQLEEQLTDRATEMVYRIFDRAADNPAIRKACQPVMRSKPRPAPMGEIAD